MLNKILIFKNMSHYSNYRHEIMSPGRIRNNYGAPLIFEIPGHDLNWEFYNNKVTEYMDFNEVSCPLCFWNHSGLVYLKPWVERKEITLANGDKKTIVIINESFGKCPHRHKRREIRIKKDNVFDSAKQEIVSKKDKKETKALSF